MSITNKTTYLFAIFSLVLLCQINSLPVTAQLSFIKSYVFVFFIIVTIGIIFFRLYSYHFSIFHFISLLFLLILLTFGLRNGRYFDDLKILSYILFTFFILMVSGFLGTNNLERMGLAGRAISYLMFFQLLALLPFVGIYKSGSFSIIDLNDDNLLVSSQRVSYIFSVSALILSAYYYKNKNVLFLLGCLIFITLSFMGGGRGESISGLLVVLLIIPTRARVLLIGLIITILILIYIIEVIPAGLTLDRLEVIYSKGNWGGRVAIYESVLNTLKQHPQSILYGLGANEFQYINNLDFSKYPHNILIESLLTSGFILVILILYKVIVSFLNLLEVRKLLDWKLLVFFGFLIFNFLISMKSGSLWGSWGFLSLITIAPIRLIKSSAQTAFYVHAPPNLKGS